MMSPSQVACGGQRSATSFESLTRKLGDEEIRHETGTTAVAIGERVHGHEPMMIASRNFNRCISFVRI